MMARSVIMLYLAVTTPKRLLGLGLFVELGGAGAGKEESVKLDSLSSILLQQLKCILIN